MIKGSSITIFFNSRATNSFIFPLVLECCGLVAARQEVGWEVKLASRARVSINSLVRGCQVKIGDLTTTLNLCIIPLGSYGIVLGMDWLYTHRAKLDYRQKRIEFLDDYGTPIVNCRIQRGISLRMISSMQLKISM